MEEIRVYREQLKRLKDIFVRTNKAMQESENARYRAEEELQHLRNLAFEQNLPEREELISALQRLRAEYESVERDKVALEKYVHNLEKNQRCERTRLLRQQRDLQAKYATLASTVRGLQTDLQEKQRMLEAHAQRGRSRSTTRGTADPAVVRVLPPPEQTPQQQPAKTLKSESKATPLTTIVGAQSYDEWPEFEVAEPLKTQPLPRPVKVQNDIKVIKKDGVVAARGDSMEVSEMLQKLPASTTQRKSTTIISDLVREVTTVEEKQDEFQAETVNEKKFSHACSVAISKAARDGDSAKLGSQILQCDRKEEKTAHLKEPRLQHPHLTATNTVKNADSNNTNSADNTGNTSGTRLASKLFDVQANSAPPSTSYASLKQKVVGWTKWTSLFGAFSQYRMAIG
ncbi:unnamed protein product [Taenia asiatica]|uniref:Lebercilin domain-containing protein n=1 Tax=Taenia asiatica TaxID=60517 RepID=A0A0R3W4A9_TAEAS|nr:unnamed protein product [Taenia asiatica]